MLTEKEKFEISTRLAKRRITILKIVATTVAIVGAFATVDTTYNILTTDYSPTILANEAIGIVTIVIGVSGYLLARTNRQGLIQIGAYLVTGFWTLAIFLSLFLTSFSALTVAALVLPILTAGLLFTPKEILIWLGGILLAFTIAFIITLTTSNLSTTAKGVGNVIIPLDAPTLITSYVFFLILFSILGLGLWFLQVNMGAVLDEVKLQVEQLANYSQEREQKRQAGEEVSGQLNLMTSELNTMAIQQARRAHQQAQAVVEMSSTLHELGETARQIATNAKVVKIASENGLNSAQKVYITSQKVNATAIEGQVAVNNSIQSIDEAQQGIGKLIENLTELANDSIHINSVITLISNIADETHLLALNAAIESAGAGQQGERFEVVAAEIKNLANRAITAVRNVSETVSKLQTSVGAAVKASEETSQKTYQAVAQSKQAGAVIIALDQVLGVAAVNSLEIVDIVKQIVEQTETISIATLQQESSVNQSVVTMVEVDETAQSSANATQAVSNTIETINELSVKLKAILDTRVLTIPS
jgi:methyl-accepting chemotaxis protein